MARDVIEARIGRKVVEAGLSIQQRSLDFAKDGLLVQEEDDALREAARLRFFLDVLDELTNGQIRHETIKVES